MPGRTRRTRRAGRVSSPQRASLATNRRRQRRRRHLHFCPNFSVSQAWAPTGGGGGAEGGASGRGTARGAGLRETGGRAAAIGRLNVVGPRRCKALAYWRAGPRARPSPRLGGRGCAFRGARARSGRRGGNARAPEWHFGLGPVTGLADPDDLPVLLVLRTRQGALGSRDARPLAAGGYVSAISRPESGGPGGDFVFPSL